MDGPSYNPQRGVLITAVIAPLVAYAVQPASTVPLLRASHSLVGRLPLPPHTRSSPQCIILVIEEVTVSEMSFIKCPGEPSYPYHPR